jgi:NAD(P)-dependent dehydrogenase (short-subunit alcohol dehydrogenase family)
MKAFSIIVTGGSSGIGLEAVRSIASREPKATIIVASRDVSKIEHAVQSVRNETGADVRGLELDLASFESVRSFVAKFRLLKAPPLRDLICNAGVNMTEFKTRFAEKKNLCGKDSKKKKVPTALTNAFKATILAISCCHICSAVILWKMVVESSTLRAELTIREIRL